MVRGRMYGCSGSCSDSKTIHIDSIPSYAHHQGLCFLRNDPVNRGQETDHCLRVKDLRHNGFYIDAACFVLVLNMLGADELDPEDLALIRSCLNCLAQMLPSRWEVLSHSLYAIEHMVTLVEKAK
jgi:hypothetical protein